MSDAKTDSAAGPTAEAAAATPMLLQDGGANVAPPPQADNVTTSPLPKSNPPTSIDLEQAKPKDFDGKLATDDVIPSEATLAKVADYPLLDKHGKSHTFKSLYNSRNGARRVLVIFVRHFFCGNCQEYIQSLAESISSEALLGLPVSTSMAIVGCGDPALIDMYVEATRCPFPLYTDPKSALFDALGMVKTLAPGDRPAYMKSGLLRGSLRGIAQALRQLPRGLALKSGDQRQVGGEFLFEPLDLVTPVATPNEGQGAGAAAPAIMDAFEQHATQAGGGGGGDGSEQTLEEKKVTWCHRMRTTRDHAEIPELMELLGLDGHGQPIKDIERWEKTIKTRKGTGFSMASRMNELKAAEKAAETKA